MTKETIWVIAAVGVFSAVAGAEFIPGDIASVGLTRIVPDTTAGDIGGHYGQNFGDGPPYLGVLGTDIFLFISGTYAESAPGVPYPSGSNKGRFAVAFQRATGGPHGSGECFFDDAGNPFRDWYNAVRSGRIAGDPRPGGTNFITGGEASPHELPAVFGTMPPGPTYYPYVPPSLPPSRYGCIQLYSLDRNSLTQMMASELMDVLQGVSGVPAVREDVTRFGGEVAALSNGNFVAVVDDGSNLLAGYRVPTAVIVRPDGTIVKPAFPVGPPYSCRIWSNVAAHKDGFVVRCAGCGAVMRFYDNDGNFLGQVSQDDPNFKDGVGNRLYLPAERGDKARIAGHVNSPYVFVAGQTTGNPLFTDKDVVTVAAWDARTRTYVGQANVTELTPEHGGVGADTDDFQPNWNMDTPRVTLAVDALNRVCVVFTRGTAANMQNQIAARVLAFDPNSGTFTHLTHSFWAFVNYCGDMSADCWAIRGVTPSVAMTTRAICIAAQGEINLQNQPENGANSPYAVNYYTVISHPDPQDDPTPPAECPGTYGDTDGDGDVDLADFGTFQGCFNGPNRVYAGEARVCGCLDAEGDGDVDLADFGAFQGCFNGPNRPAACL